MTSVRTITPSLACPPRRRRMISGVHTSGSPSSGIQTGIPESRRTRWPMLRPASRKSARRMPCYLTMMLVSSMTISTPCRRQPQPVLLLLPDGLQPNRQGLRRGHLPPPAPIRDRQDRHLEPVALRELPQEGTAASTAAGHGAPTAGPILTRTHRGNPDGAAERVASIIFYMGY